MVLLSDVSEDEKFQKLDKILMQGIKELTPWIVTDFEASAQLKERVLLATAGFSNEEIAERIKNSVGGFGTKPEEKSEDSKNEIL